MFNESPKCRVCSKEIEGGEPVQLEMRYPTSRGFAEVKAYLKLEAQFTCDACAKKKH